MKATCMKFDGAPAAPPDGDAGSNDARPVRGMAMILVKITGF
ncbi:MAG: hypothetical protein CFH40_00558 [Alphaproteobacteria bacterium MarineAlpha10_Bin3]|nr:MAG: hypothetical protein CFH40_00558 [Alphaproteobacteria bacterium MarineAlpha10_Bin3]PPR74592.1 MAG: hypothetical protein CFH09_00558 [Alphaproteobacteria bacterium MarineAlpha4_Bin1]